MNFDTNIEKEVNDEIDQQIKQGKNEIEIFNNLIEYNKPKKEMASSTHKVRLDADKDITTDIKSHRVETPDEVRISEEYQKMMELEFTDFSDKEEFLRDRAERIVKLKKQYEDYNRNKDQLEKFAKKGKEDLSKTKEDKERIYAPDLKTDMDLLGFRVNWHPLNEKVAKHVLKIKEGWGLTDKEAKQWFYIIRREEIKIKKALEIL